MNTTMDSNLTETGLRNALVLHFARASVELFKARAQQRNKDTPAGRVAVAAAREHVDAILDTYLAARHGVGRLTVADCGSRHGQSVTGDP